MIFRDRDFEEDQILISTALLLTRLTFGGVEVSSSLDFVEISLFSKLRAGQKAPNNK